MLCSKPLVRVSRVPGKTGNRLQVPSLEGSDPLLQDSYVTRKKPIDTCAEIARKHEYKGMDGTSENALANGFKLWAMVPTLLNFIWPYEGCLKGKVSGQNTNISLILFLFYIFKFTKYTTKLQQNRGSSFGIKSRITWMEVDSVR